ncbi:MAG: phosphorylase family protein [Promethearchaeota archaeon]
MSKLLKSLKAKVLDIGIKFLSLDEKVAYIAFKTKSSNVNPIVILHTGESTLKKLLRRMKDHKKIGNIHNGTIGGVEVSVIRAGMGCPHASMVMEGLKRSHCKCIIRVDYCGALKTMDNELDVADVIIPQEVLLTDGTAHSYLQKHVDELINLPLSYYPVEKSSNYMLYPSHQEKYLGIQADPTLFKTIQDSVSSNSYDFITKYGKLWSVDALFCETNSAIQTWKSYGATSVDMESSAVYLLGNLFKIPSISILGISDLPDVEQWNFQKTNKIHPKYDFILDNAIDVLVDTLPEINN